MADTVMWICKKCGEQVEESFDSCWKCSAPRGAPSDVPVQQTRPAKWRMEYRIFRGVFATWDDLFRQAADFANEIGPERVVSISHSEDKDDGVVAVWYWKNDAESA